MSEEQTRKLEEENKSITLENDNRININHFSFRQSEFMTSSEMLDCCNHINKHGLTIWDHSVDNNQAAIIDIGLGLRANLVILHSFNNRNEKIAKLNRYAELIEELY